MALDRKEWQNVAERTVKQRFDVSIPTILKIRKAEGYSLPANAKTLEARWNPDRDQQFHHINEKIKDNYQCVICGQGKREGLALHADHIRPKELGGKALVENG
ncbi:MAG: hypothetical protein OXC63_15630 [Aestuariivita sp.]|nr:hypothetical protein [Aestuariivita sp.]